MTTTLILSKKGFDTENGCGPSPILADGRMVSLPIPEPRQGVCAATYGSLRHDNRTYVDLLNHLGYHIPATTAAHLDPDLIATARARPSGWRGMFGQVDQAESHLANNGVGKGALFLFWGWFEHFDGSRPISRIPGFSALYGYLEVEEVLPIGSCGLPPFVSDHPHVAPEYPRTQNRIYVARERLSWNSNKPGWGVFKYQDGLRLSVPGGLRSLWQLPGCCHPNSGCKMTFNSNSDLWSWNGDDARVQIPGRGQEFVCSPTEEVLSWARNLIDTTEVWTDRGSASSSSPRQPATTTFSAANTSAPIQFANRPSPSLESNSCPKVVTPDAGAAASRLAETSPMPSKPIIAPLPDEGRVSYGDRLLWHQLGLQINGHRQYMLTEEEYVTAILRHYPDASVQNLRIYRNYFNNKHKSMGFREAAAMPIPVEFVKPAGR